MRTAPPYSGVAALLAMQRPSEAGAESHPPAAEQVGNAFGRCSFAAAETARGGDVVVPARGAGSGSVFDGAFEVGSACSMVPGGKQDDGVFVFGSGFAAGEGGIAKGADGAWSRPRHRRGDRASGGGGREAVGAALGLSNRFCLLEGFECGDGVSGGPAAVAQDFSAARHAVAEEEVAPARGAGRDSGIVGALAEDSACSTVPGGEQVPRRRRGGRARGGGCFEGGGKAPVCPGAAASDDFAECRAEAKEEDAERVAERTK